MLRRQVSSRSLQRTLHVRRSLFALSITSSKPPLVEGEHGGFTFSRVVRPLQLSNSTFISAIPLRNHSFKSLLDDMNRDAGYKESLKPQRNNNQSFERLSKRNGSSEHRNSKKKHHNSDHHGFRSNYVTVNRYKSISNDIFLDLEKRSIQHKTSFPSDTDDSKAVLQWHSTTVELIMEWAKFWGKNRGSNQVSPEQVSRGVALADELMTRMLEITKSELARATENSKQLQDSINPSLRVHMHRKNKQSKALDMEICCQMIALGWSRCDPKTISKLNAPRKAQAILESLEEICHMHDRLLMSATRQLSFTRHSVTPTTRLYNHVLSCWSRSSDPDAEVQARELLNRMASNNDTFSAPDTISYNNMLHLYANKGNVEKAENLLKQMEDPNMQTSVPNVQTSVQFPEDHEIKADVFSYSIVTNALRKRFVSSGTNRDIPVRAEKIVQQMVKKGIMPNEVCFSTVLSMYAVADRLARDEVHETKSRKWKDRVSMSNTVGWGAENAERVLEWIIDLYERDAQDGKSLDVKINAQHFTTVIDAWAKAGKGVEGAKTCERLCDALVLFYEKSGFKSYLRPRPECFGAVIDAWSKADKEYGSAEHAEAVLDKMETYFLQEKSDRHYMLSNVAYNLTIDAWSRRSGKDAAKRAENILHRMIKNYHLTNNKSLRPDVISYTAVMKAYVGHPDGGRKALELLQEMEKEGRDGNVRAKPDAQAISIAMDACVKSGLLDDASRLLDDLDDSKKTRVMFNTLISAYKQEGSGDKAEHVLRTMIDLSKAGYRNCSPDSTTYAMCIYAWSASENGTSQQRLDKAKSLFDECIQGYHDGEDLMKPSSTHFNTLAHAMATSDDPNKELLVLSLFKEMENSGLAPCIVTFNILIKACASTNGSQEKKEKSLQIAASAFNSIKSSGLIPDTITYTSMIHAILNLTENPKDKVNAVSGIFQMCCADGCLNQHILNTLSDATSESEFALMTSLDRSTRHQVGTLPLEWSRNSRTVSEEEKLFGYEK